MGFPPEPQELRRKKIGRVIVNTASDRTWSQYFCCLVFAGKEFVARRPLATKRALRHHVEPAEDPGRWRLAVPERAQEGTEGIA
jgi:NitT/TauT family transport system substrate-binding protein